MLDDDIDYLIGIIEMRLGDINERETAFDAIFNIKTALRMVRDAVR